MAISPDTDTDTDTFTRHIHPSHPSTPETLPSAPSSDSTRATCAVIGPVNKAGGSSRSDATCDSTRPDQCPWVPNSSCPNPIPQLPATSQQAARHVRLMPQPPASPASPAPGPTRLLRYPGKLPHHAVTLTLPRLIMFQFSTRLPCPRMPTDPRPVPPSPRITLQWLHAAWLIMVPIKTPRRPGSISHSPPH